MVVPTTPRNPPWAVCAPIDIEQAGIAFRHHDLMFVSVEMFAKLSS